MPIEDGQGDGWRTIIGEVSFCGTGINCGQDARVTIRPGTSGITWACDGEALRSARFESYRNTTAVICAGSPALFCIEHLAAALYLAKVTDVVVDVTGSRELPFLDGSAWPYFSSLQDMPGVPVDRHEKSVAPQESLYHPSGDLSGWYAAIPCCRLRIGVHTEFPPPLGAGFVHSDEIAAAFLAKARSFIRDPLDVVSLDRARGRLKGLDAAIANDALILWDTDSVRSALRFDREWRYHKLLDLIGDLAADGHRIVAEVVAHRPGHAANSAFRELLLRAAQ